MLRIEGVTKAYEGFRLGEVTLDLPDRSFTVLLGPSGSGKTSLLRLISGLERPDAGRILQDGDDITRLPAERRGVGLVFQDGALFPHLSVRQNVAFGVRDPQRALDALALVDLADKADRRIDRLSGGERQRVALARALAPRPKTLLYDEPLANLDRNLREELRAHLRRLHDELGLTSVLVTHDREEALALADKLVVMSAGRIVEAGTPRDLFRSPRTAFTARLLGAANVLRHGGRTLLVPYDAVTLTPSATGKGVVRAVRFAGFHEEVEVATDDGEQLVAHAKTAPAIGERVRIDLDEARLRVVAD